MNRVELSGHVYHNESKNENLANFSLRWKPPYKDSKVEFIPCEAWDNEYRKLATRVKTFEHKSPIEVEGRMRARSYEVNGEKKTKVYLEVDNVGYCPKAWENNSQKSSESFSFDSGNAEQSSDNLPF